MQGRCIEEKRGEGGKGKRENGVNNLHWLPCGYLGSSGLFVELAEAVTEVVAVFEGGIMVKLKVRVEEVGSRDGGESIGLIFLGEVAG